DIGQYQSVKLSYAFTKQYMHLLSNSTVGLPTDVWISPDEHLKPQESHQFVAGYYRRLDSQGVELSAEVYYKTMNNLVDYKDNADLFMNKHLATQLLHGKGYSYGLELLAECRSGRLSGWIGYTLAKTQYKIDGVNQNRYYSPRYDIRHNLSLTGSYELTHAWTISSTFKLTSGGFVTIPDQIYEFNGCAFFDYSGRNNYALPAYHRLDLSAIYRNPKNDTRKYDSQWMFSLYNVYGRKNIYSLYVKQDMDISQSRAYKMYLYRIVPSISYKVKF
ncbi:MAG: TonB-dependent receptor, partial [Salinivirgaceae bacterium]|nr:TonB-dependent receptor [Salinivirgaceae bacterium]